MDGIRAHNVGTVRPADTLADVACAVVGGFLSLVNVLVWWF